ncbi:MAG: hypothetical protein Kow0042_02840 [Calditrichia bacterium]
MDGSVSASFKNINSISSALLGYMVAVILIMTLAPFRFEIAHAFQITGYTDLSDIFNNIFLFLPFGFLFHVKMRNRRDHIYRRVILSGLLLSLLIEFCQLFLSGRYASPVDVLTNACGAGLGAWLFAVLRNKLKERSTGLLSFDLPLIHLIYLLIPMLWMNALVTDDRFRQLLLMILLAVMGGMIFTATYKNWLAIRSATQPRGMALVASLWFLFSSFPLVFKSPRLVLAVAGLLGLGVFFRCCFPGRLSGDRRFEVSTLKRLLPIFTFYLFLMIFWPPAFPEFHLQVSFGLNELADDPTIPSIFFLLEYISALTLLGYMVAELAGRWPNENMAGVGWIYFFITSISAELEFLRALHPMKAFSFLHFFMGIAGGMFGIMIYHLQMKEVLKIRRRGRNLAAFNNLLNGEFHRIQE